MTNEEYIAKFRDADVNRLALSKAPEGIDLQFCLQQIAGRQTAERKLPSWAKEDDILFPPRVSMEQCSSEQTALYKQQLVARLMPEIRQNIVDLTGGFGVDFSYLARLFDEADYVEREKSLCESACHNFPLLGLNNTKIHNESCEKVVALGDCSPNVESLQDKLLEHAPLVLIKLSPMLDIQDTLRRLKHVGEVHVVSVDGECKEVLLVLERDEKDSTTYHCINIGAKTQFFCTDSTHAEPKIAQELEKYLYEPNASILKAGVQNGLCQAYDVEKLHAFSHLFISSRFIENFPGRIFTLEDIYNFSKKDVKRLQSEVGQCNLTIRNFPSSVADLRKRLKLREGGDSYLFATTLADGQHVLLRCRQV